MSRNRVDNSNKAMIRVAESVAKVHKRSNYEGVIGKRVFDSISAHLMLPRLCAFYPFSSIDDAHDVYDISGQGRKLTNVSTTVTSDVAGFMPYAIFDSTQSDYLSRTDESALDLLVKDIFIGGWFRFPTLTDITDKFIFCKYGLSGNRSYGLLRTEGSVSGTYNSITFLIYDNVDTLYSIEIEDIIVENEWHSIRGMYRKEDGNIEVRVDRQAAVADVGSITLKNSTANLTMAAMSGGSIFQTMHASMVFLTGYVPSDPIANIVFDSCRGLFENLQ